MASIFRPALLFSRAHRTASSPWTGAAGIVANFASSSRVRLDTSPSCFSRVNTTSASTTTFVGEEMPEPLPSLVAEGEAERSVSAHQSPSTSNPNPDPIPNHQIPPQKASPIPQPNSLGGVSSSSSIPSRPSHIPQFTTSRQVARSPYAGLRWTPETVDFSYPISNSDLTPTHTLHIRSTRNNVLLTLTDGLGPLFGTVTGGTDRTFKNAQRSTYEAAAQAAIKMFERVADWSRETKINKKHEPKLRISYNGLFGSAREAVTTTLAGPQGSDIRRLIVRVEDRTKVKIGGVRARKPRRL
ncbi:hypothetical protein I312_103297 [Cryptococcus bacillisporus CA1280]|uniref:Unplaced genomic scaffold supercont1.8, whole genome shotgun sequence n=1 Tax=Cryptococcus bacillisporus CA1280 TaxID=1296109 RepID=A0A0D0VQ70_CRYGA|nr:hypothetical protein I312_03151 [Cryptococcus bacillisporus CA1280]